MKESVVLVQFAGRNVALPANQVDSIIEIDKITPVPGTPSYVAGIYALRSQALTVIDCTRALKLVGCQQTNYRQAAVVNCEGHRYALLLDAVKEVTEVEAAPMPIPGGAGEGWSRVSLGLVQTSAGSAMLIDVDALINVDQEKAH